MSALLVVALGVLMQAAGTFQTGDERGSAGVAMTFGYLTLTALLVGDLFARARLPRLTGYLATGLVAGPDVLGLVTRPALESLGLVNGVAVALIALNAGSELDLRAMRPLLRSVAWITAVARGGVIVALAVAVALLRSRLPFLAPLAGPQVAAAALTVAVVLSAGSPAVVVALRDELGAQGPLSRIVLGVVVLGDLAVILLFAAASSVLRAALGGGIDAAHMAGSLAWQVLGSLGVGVALGGVLAFYLSRVRSGASLFVFALCFAAAEVGRRVDLDPLLIALAAGVLVRNATRVGDALRREVEASALPVTIVFFAVAGASIHVHAVAAAALPAIVLVLVRGATLVAGGRLGARLAAAPPEVGRWVGFGLAPQAGLALALAMLFARTSPELGAGASTLMLGVVAINELIAPALYRAALVRSGEGSAKGVDAGAAGH